MSLNQAIAVASLVFTVIAGTWAVSTYFSPKGEVEKANEKVEKAREEMAKKRGDGERT